MAEITVVMAVYNGADWLPAQLASLRAQDAEDFSVLVQDDGSADASPQLIRNVCACDSRFSEGSERGRHLGAKGNFLSLLRQSPGPYTALCDQDDEWRPDRLSRCLAAMREAEKRWGEDCPLLVHSDCAVTDAGGTLLHHSFFAHQGWDPAAVALPRLLVQNNVTGCTVLINRALQCLAAEHGDAGKMFMHDWFLALTAAACGHIVWVGEPLVRYRQHGGNVLGASRSGLTARAVRALRAPAQARERIALTYRSAAAFRDMMGGALPDEAAAVIDRYLASQSLPRLQRIRAVRRGGYLMQSRTARAGQILFG